MSNGGTETVSRVRGSDGKLLETWTGAAGTVGVLVALGRVFVPGFDAPGLLYRIDPRQPPGAVETVASNLGSFPEQIAFDGDRIWTANSGSSVSIVTPAATTPWTVTTVTTGFEEPAGALYDGTNIWVTDRSAGTLLKLNNSAAILQAVTVGTSPKLPLFDGTNIWVSNENSNSISVVRASTGVVLATLTGNGLDFPAASAFDGQRVLVANNGDNNTVSLWKAADLTPIGFFSTGADTHPFGACSDGTSFWITLATAEKFARF